MMPCKSFLVLLLVTYATAASLESRTITRSERPAAADVVEYAIGGKLQGRCSYIDRTKRSISLVYEEQNGVVKARSLNAVVEDPVEAVRECRAAANKGQIEERSDMEGPRPLERKEEESNSYRKGRQFIDTRDPRFITWLGSMFGSGANIGSSHNNNFGLSWGNTGNSYNPLPGVNLFAAGNNGNSHLTTTHGSTNPFDFLNAHGNTGPWGVLNSISNNRGGGIFGLGGLFGGGLGSPFGFWG